MNYEQKYKEALKRARQTVADIPNTPVAEWLRVTFPELEESENERIRKWIKGLLSTYEHDLELRDEALAWLEKQKPYHPVPQKEATGVLKELLDEERKLSEWSNEDENMLEAVIINVTELRDRFGEHYGKTGKCIDWLESLKQRITKQD